MKTRRNHRVWAALVATAMLGAPMTLAGAGRADAATGPALAWTQVTGGFLYGGDPSRVVDTSTGLNGLAGPLTPNQTYVVDVAALVPPATQNLVFRVAITGFSATGRLELSSGGTVRQIAFDGASAQHYQLVSVARAPGSGSLSIRSSVAAQVSVDLLGTLGGAASGAFVPATGTVSAGLSSSNPTVVLNLAGLGTLPSAMGEVGAVAVNVVAETRMTQPLRAYATGIDPPTGASIIGKTESQGQALIQPSVDGQVTVTCDCGFATSVRYRVDVQGYFPISPAALDYSSGAVDGSSLVGTGTSTTPFSPTRQARVDQLAASTMEVASSGLDLQASPLGYSPGSQMSNGGAVLDGEGPDSYDPSGVGAPNVGTWVYDSHVSGRTQGSDATACGPAATVTTLTSYYPSPWPTNAEVKAYERTTKYGTSPFRVESGLDHYLGADVYRTYKTISNTALWNEVTYYKRVHSWNIVDAYVIPVYSKKIWYPNASPLTMHYLVIYGFSMNYQGKKAYLVWDPVPQSQGGGRHTLAQQDFQRVAVQGQLVIAPGW